MEVLVALGILGLALATVVVALGAWTSQFRRMTAAWRCREVLEVVRTEARAPQRLCRGGVREIQRGACRGRMEPAPDCETLRVRLWVGGREFATEWALSGYR